MAQALKVNVYDGVGDYIGTFESALATWNLMKAKSLMPSYPAKACKMDGTFFNYSPSRYTSFSDWFHLGR